MRWFFVTLVALSGCSRQAPSPVLSIPVTLPADEWIGGRVAFNLVAESVVSVNRTDASVTLRDRRALRRAANGDFEVDIGRIHQGSEAGDTDESFRAVSVGGRYYTRGAGGPFVRWDDARDEPLAAAASVLEGSLDLLTLLKKCGREKASGSDRIYEVANSDCRIESLPTQVPFNLIVRGLHGEVRAAGGRPSEAYLKLGAEFETEGRRADVTLEHSLTISDLPAVEVIVEPTDAVPARRDRPVAMVRSVLGGLVAGWREGAPEVLRRPSRPDR
jgi:hypothetical protein